MHGSYNGNGSVCDLNCKFRKVTYQKYTQYRFFQLSLFEQMALFFAQPLKTILLNILLKLSFFSKKKYFYSDEAILLLTAPMPPAKNINENGAINKRGIKTPPTS